MVPARATWVMTGTIGNKGKHKLCMCMCGRSSAVCNVQTAGLVQCTTTASDKIIYSISTPR